MKRIHKVAVLGAGTMGARIAAHFANAGIPTYLLDIVPPNADASMRNKLAAAGLDAALKSKPAAFFQPALASLITIGNFEDDLKKLFDGKPKETRNQCHRDTMDGGSADWMEWQAGFACGALLMPQAALSAAIRRVGDERQLPAGKFSATSEHGLALISAIATHFSVSREAARVRLHQRNVLVGSAHAGALFL